MARITVEDCLEHVSNRFTLVIEASKRARNLAMGRAEPIVEWENDKPTVVALREIAAGHSFVDSEEESGEIQEKDVFISKEETVATEIASSTEVKTSTEVSFSDPTVAVNTPETPTSAFTSIAAPIIDSLKQHAVDTTTTTDTTENSESPVASPSKTDPTNDDADSI